MLELKDQISGSSAVKMKNDEHALKIYHKGTSTFEINMVNQSNWSIRNYSL
jgi:hypothetical protein